jgi:DNA-binding NtrC family response regulator
MAPQGSVHIITQNEAMRAMISRIDRVANTDSSILLIGETGVGKEILAEYIHRTSNRSPHPLIKISLSAVPSDLLASELFGYEKGAFTGARESRKGLFELAHTGSIFLDDIDDVPLEMQIKLLRFLENREFRRVGGTHSIAVDVRIISASKVPLEEIVRQRSFRKDLFYRLNVIPFTIPPLRERRDDIPLLAEYFIRQFGGEQKPVFTPEALSAMMAYNWPGNVRELRNVVQRVLAFVSGDKIQRTDLPPEILYDAAIDQIVDACKSCFLVKGFKLSDIVKCVESNLIFEALRKAGGNQSEAARLLQISLSTFRDKMTKYSDLPAKCIPKEGKKTLDPTGK